MIFIRSITSTKTITKKKEKNNMSGFIPFKQSEKLKHYSAIAKGDKPVKSDSKFSEAEQRAYARGQRDARNENNRIFAIKNATPEQRQAYKEARKAKRRK